MKALVLLSSFAVMYAAVLNPPRAKPPCDDYMGNNKNVRCWELAVGKCYCFALYNVTTWEEAEMACKTERTELVTIESQEEHDLIANHIFAEDVLPDDRYESIAYYTSARFDGTRFTWTATGAELNYTNWDYREPQADEIDAGCVALYSSYFLQWGDVVCSSECCPRMHSYFICEYDSQA